MTVGVNAINRPLITARPRQEASCDQDSLGDKPLDSASEQHPLKLVFSNMERPGVTARWKSVENSSFGTRTPGSHNVGSVYERIKLSLLQRPWIPGELLQIGVFARELGTSTTPVREALVRLATERLIAYAPKKGFLVKAVTEEELRGLYFVNQMHVQTALHYSGERDGNVPERNSSGSIQPPAEPSDRATELAFITANLFLSIAASAGIEEIVASIYNINSRLHRPRIAEYSVIDGVPQEVSAMDELFAAGKREKLREAIRRYHEVRLQMLPSICKELLSMSFARR